MPDGARWHVFELDGPFYTKAVAMQLPRQQTCPGSACTAATASPHHSARFITHTHFYSQHNSASHFVDHAEIKSHRCVQSLKIGQGLELDSLLFGKSLPSSTISNHCMWSRTLGDQSTPLWLQNVTPCILFSKQCLHSGYSI